MTAEQQHTTHELESENLELRIRISDIHDALLLTSHMWAKINVAPENREQRIYRRAFLQAFNRAQAAATPDWEMPEEETL